jgi:hypothetical protein
MRHPAHALNACSSSLRRTLTSLHTRLAHATAPRHVRRAHACVACTQGMRMPLYSARALPAIAQSLLTRQLSERRGSARGS